MSNLTENMIKVGENTVRNMGNGSKYVIFPRAMEVPAGERIEFFKSSEFRETVLKHIKKNSAEENQQ